MQERVRAVFLPGRGAHGGEHLLRIRELRGGETSLFGLPLIEPRLTCLAIRLSRSSLDAGPTVDSRSSKSLIVAYLHSPDEVGGAHPEYSRERRGETKERLGGQEITRLVEYDRCGDVGNERDR